MQKLVLSKFRKEFKYVFITRSFTCIKVRQAAVPGQGEFDPSVLSQQATGSHPGEIQNTQVAVQSRQPGALRGTDIAGKAIGHHVGRGAQINHGG